MSPESLRRATSAPDWAEIALLPAPYDGYPPLDRQFMAREATIVARELLGKLIIRLLGPELLVARIVETEAYAGDLDQASHSFRGVTRRNQSMFGAAGRAYVYRCYGIHTMLNVVTTQDHGPASAVLLRAMEPVHGIEVMQRLRGITDPDELLRGPGNIGKGLAIGAALDGHDLSRPPLLIVDAPTALQPIVVSRRVGIRKSADLPWRYYLFGSQCVSRRDRQAEEQITDRCHVRFVSGGLPRAPIQVLA